jgi:aspartyl protease family protein
MVDTGASVVALNRAEAARVAVDLQQATRSIARTANGTIPVWNVTLPSVQLGDILIRNVEAQVSEGGAEQSPIVLLGNSFLRHVDLIRSGSVLIVEKRW